MLSGTIFCAVEDETQKAMFRYTDVHTDESEGDDYGKGEFCSSWREVTPGRASTLQVVSHVMMTKAQDPLDLPRLDSVQNISPKKKSSATDAQ